MEYAENTEGEAPNFKCSPSLVLSTTAPQKCSVEVATQKK